MILLFLMAMVTRKPLRKGVNRFVKRCARLVCFVGLKFVQPFVAFVADLTFGLSLCNNS